jgi:hypothetical protein
MVRIAQGVLKDSEGHFGTANKVLTLRGWAKEDSASSFGTCYL